MFSKTLFLLSLPIMIFGCAATPLQAPQAANILLTRNAPPPNCRFLGEVRGSQGNVLTADFTRDEHLVVGARNKMRDAAFQLGANYVQIELENASDNTADYSTGGVYTAVVIGNAYDCPPTGSAQLVQNR